MVSSFVVDSVILINLMINLMINFVPGHGSRPPLRAVLASSCEQLPGSVRWRVDTSSGLPGQHEPALLQHCVQVDR